MKKEEREKILAEMQEVIEQNNIQPTPTLPDDAIIVCARAEGFDLAEANQIFNDPLNQSVLTDYECGGCKYKVVMSNWTKQEFERLGHKNKILCPECMGIVVNPNLITEPKFDA